MTSRLLDVILQGSQAKDWLGALKDLNTNLETLAVLLESYKDTGEAIKDIRTMLAELLGWKVVHND